MAKKLPKIAPRLPSTDARAESFVRGTDRPEELAAPPPPPGSLTAELLHAEAGRQTLGAFYRLWPEQVEWLTKVAFARKAQRGGRGRADASEVLRLVLDKAIEKWKLTEEKAG